MTTVRVEDARARAKLKRIARTLRGETSDMTPVYRAVAVSIQTRYFTENFRQKGKLTQPWPDIGLITAVLRPKGRHKKYKDEDEVSALAKSKMKPLDDTGSLRQSFAPGGPGSIFEFTSRSARAGSRDKRAGLFQEGFTSVFVFGDDKKDRIKDNIKKRLPGPPEKKPGRKKTHANPFLGQMIATMRGMHGKTYVVKKRLLRHEGALPGKWKRVFLADAAKEIQAIKRKFKSRTT